MAAYSLNWCLQVKQQVGYNYVTGLVQNSYQIKLQLATQQKLAYIVMIAL